MRIDLENVLVNKICPDLAAADKLVKSWQAAGDKVVFTNGVFDLLHLGHITYLAKAASEGNKLIIGLNSDASVKRIKGESRPVNDQTSRAALLAAMFFVDAIVVFGEDTPSHLISTLLPDILIKGADYQIENIVGAQEVLANGGEVKTITFVDGYSSTSIINRIKNQQQPG